MAHGRTRHNRSFKPLFIDIEKGEPVDFEQESESEEEQPRKKRVVEKQERVVEKKRKEVFHVDKKKDVDVEDVNVFMSWVDYVHAEMDHSAKRIERLKSFASQKHIDEYQKKYYDLMNHLDLTRAQIDQTKVAMNC
jgi:hypothetical protein